MNSLFVAIALLLFSVSAEAGGFPIMCRWTSDLDGKPVTEGSKFTWDFLDHSMFVSTRIFAQEITERLVDEKLVSSKKAKRDDCESSGAGAYNGTGGLIYVSLAYTCKLPGGIYPEDSVNVGMHYDFLDKKGTYREAWGGKIKGLRFEECDF